MDYSDQENVLEKTAIEGDRPVSEDPLLPMSILSRAGHV